MSIVSINVDSWACRLSCVLFCICFLFLWRCRFFRVFLCTITVFSLYWRVRRTFFFPFRMVRFYLVTTGWIFDTSFYVIIQSINQSGLCGPREQGVVRDVHVLREGRRVWLRRRYRAGVGPAHGRVQAHVRGARVPRGRGDLPGEVSRDIYIICLLC